jgi:hypothetical protein
LKAGELVMIGSDDLNARRQTLIPEARWHSQRRTARHCDEKHGFHPFVIRRHLLTSNLLRPTQINIERKQLCSWSD